MDTRMDLVRCYHMLHHLGLTDLISAHVSTICESQRAYWISRFGVSYSRVAAEDLVRVSIGSSWHPGESVSPSAKYLHSAIYDSRPDVACVLHCHPPPVVALFAVQSEFQIICQQSAAFYDEVNYVEYSAAAVTPEECARLAWSLGSRRVLVMRGHGLLCVGKSLAEALFLTHYFNESCKTQLMALSSGLTLRTLSPEAALATHDHVWSGPYSPGQAEWAALLTEIEPGLVQSSRGR